MKIALSGTVSTGKTFLAEQLADTLDCQYIPESFDSFFESPDTVHNKLDSLVKIFFDIFKNKKQIEEKHNDFVVDRCPVDLFNLWLSAGLIKNPDFSEKFYNLCRQHMPIYDFVIITPPATIPLEQIENSTIIKKRSLDPWKLRKNHFVIVGVLYSWLPVNKIIQLPEGMSDKQERLEFILNAIGNSG